jgi:rare lipoprotein A
LWNKGKARDVTTAWYEVPPDSLARRRAREEEFTAAHNQLPIGTLVRVTHLKNGKQVLVRITDRGIYDRRVTLDVCKEAADKLGIVDRGLARVRMQVLAETSGAPAADSESTAP